MGIVQPMTICMLRNLVKIIIVLKQGIDIKTRYQQNFHMYTDSQNMKWLAILVMSQN